MLLKAVCLVPTNGNPVKIPSIFLWNKLSKCMLNKARAVLSPSMVRLIRSKHSLHIFQQSSESFQMADYLIPLLSRGLVQDLVQSGGK